MKIRLAILENDKSYLNRIASVFSTKYTDRLEIYSFTERDQAFRALEDTRVDVFLAGETFKIDKQELPSRCGFAYLVDSPDVESLWGEQSICKYQKAELIYKQILNIFSEKMAAVTGKISENRGKVVAFTGAAGGVGCSVAAAAYAIYLAGKGKKPVYLNFEALGNADSYFSGEGQGNFSDIIYAVKSRKTNLSMKLESISKRDPSGVCFFSGPGNALDMLELNIIEIGEIIRDLAVSCGYSHVVLDVGIPFCRELAQIFRHCDDVVLVSDGVRETNRKTEKMVSALEILERQGGERSAYDLSLLYNRFGSRTSQKMEGVKIRELGGIKRFEGYSAAQLSAQIAKLDVFAGLE